MLHLFMGFGFTIQLDLHVLLEGPRVYQAASESEHRSLGTTPSIRSKPTHPHPSPEPYSLETLNQLRET